MSDDQIVCLRSFAKSSKLGLPPSLEEFVGLGADQIQKLDRLLKRASKHDIQRFSCLVESVSLLAPIKSPRKIVCLGLNYRDHAAEQNAVVPDEPVIFMKPATAIVGPNEEIVKPGFVSQLDYEAELAIVVGKRVKNVSAADARSCIFGYTILNDVSARDIQFKDKQWTRGKSFDTFAPMGPCMVTEDQLRDTSDLSICTWVNEELRQKSSTKNMVFNVYDIIHHISRVMTLEPCDIISTGTPAGVGFAFKPKPKFLNKGDVVRIEIEGIGILGNRIA
jgi:2-keto-4-pentenoate hydratase/2-oxohepta-3-ene-1,7-dioic acid hydratase in catechol pathway